MNQKLAQLIKQKQDLALFYEREKGKEDQLKQQVETIQHETQARRETYEALVLKKEILEQAGVTAREQGKQLFENVVTNSIQMVFEKDAEAVVVLGKKANVATANLLIQSERGGLSVDTDPAEEDGGGLADMVSLSALTSTAMLAGATNQAGFFWDEPTKFVSAANAESTANFIAEIRRYAGRQTFLTTHERQYLPFVADRSFLVELDADGCSSVTLMYEKEVEEAPMVRSH